MKKMCSSCKTILHRHMDRFEGIPIRMTHLVCNDFMNDENDYRSCVDIFIMDVISQNYYQDYTCKKKED